MAAPQIAPLPEFFQLTGGEQIVVTAIDATTGALVAGVNITTAYADVEYVTDQEDTAPEDAKLTDFFTFGDVAA